MTDTKRDAGHTAADSLVQPLEKTTIQDAGPLDESAQTAATGSGADGQQQHVVTPANSSASRAAASAALSSSSGPSQAPQDQTEGKASQKQQKKKEKAPKEAKAKPAQAQGGAGSKDKKKETKLGLTAKKAENFPDWYTEVVREAELISYYTVSGCYIVRPNAFEVWEHIHDWFDAEIKKLGVRNAYFPMFVTEDALSREKDHVEGFAAEVAWVTKSGQSEMERPIAIRPTSETVMYPYYAEWVRSHRDLPLRLNQWNTVVRWEFKHPTPFIRTREFLWQEGHSAFASKGQAVEEVEAILDLYARIYNDLLAIPVCKGYKSDAERFAGALFTMSVEGFVPATGRGIQGGTSHCLGQNFSRMFDISFEAEDASRQLVWQNSWGFSTRSIGVMVMVHGDDKGLVLPPRVAHTQVVIIPIPNTKMPEAEKRAMMDQADKLRAELQAQGLRVKTDARDIYTPGWKYNYWELQGVPIRLELGPRDMAGQVCMAARRDTGAKASTSWADLPQHIPQLLDAIQADMYKRAHEEFWACVEKVTTWDDFVAALSRKHMALAPWANEEPVEEDVKKRSASAEAMGAKTLCIPLDQPDLPEGTACFASGKPAKNWALWGRSY